MAEQQKQDENLKVAGQNGQDSDQSIGNTDSDLEKLKKQCDEYLNGWKRAKADLMNYQKDEAKRFEAMMNFANEALVLGLIPILDSLELALKAETQNEGLHKIKVQLEDELKKSGLEKIAVSAGDPFNPAQQESIGERESDKPPGTVAEVAGTGYQLHGKVVRPARVKITK